MRDFRRCCFAGHGKLHDAAIVDTVIKSAKQLITEQGITDFGLVTMELLMYLQQQFVN